MHIQIHLLIILATFLHLLASVTLILKFQKEKSKTNYKNTVVLTLYYYFYI